MTRAPLSSGTRVSTPINPTTSLCQQDRDARFLEPAPDSKSVGARCARDHEVGAGLVGDFRQGGDCGDVVLTTVTLPTQST